MFSTPGLQRSLVQGIVSEPLCHGYLAPALCLLMLGSIYINISSFQERPLEKLCNISGSPHGALRKPLCGLGPKSFSVRQRQQSINWIWYGTDLRRFENDELICCHGIPVLKLVCARFCLKLLHPEAFSGTSGRDFVPTVWCPSSQAIHFFSDF